MAVNSRNRGEIAAMSTTEFFSNPERAHEWFVETVVVPNPRLSTAEKNELIALADGCYEFSTTPPWTDPLGLFEHGEDDAAEYFNCLRNSILSVTNDQGILAVLDIAQEGSRDVADPPDSILNQGEDIVTGKQPIKLPTWAWVGLGFAALYLWRR